MPTFKPRILLTIVACVRKNLSSGTLLRLEEYITPEIAISVYKGSAYCKCSEIASSELGENEAKAVSLAINEIVRLMPHWQGLFSAPISWGRLNDDRISLTNRAIPQHIYLGHLAFNGAQRLDEVLIHEMSHVWLGIIDEITPIAAHNSTQKFTLPSGTKNKDLHGVLLAAHFAASVITYFYTSQKSIGYQEQLASRIAYLERYLAGCIDILFNCGTLSPTGHFIASECSKANRNIQQ